MKLAFIDLDMTLFFTKGNLYIKKDGKRIKTLTQDEYNSYVREPGEEYDFHDFKSAEVLVKTAIPNQPMIDKAIQLYKDGWEVAILTARGDLDDKNIVVDFFNSYGLEVGHYEDNKIHVIRSGNDQYHIHGASPQRKRFVIESILANRPDVTEIVMYDDYDENLIEFKKIDFNSKAYLVNKDEITEF